MLEEVHTAPGNRYTYTIFIENGLIYCEWGEREVVSLSMGALQK